MQYWQDSKRSNVTEMQVCPLGSGSERLQATLKIFYMLFQRGTNEEKLPAFLF